MNAKRGYVPEDDRNFSEQAMPVLRKAAGNLCYLLDEGYSVKTASVFVGNHYLLSERQRLALVRSTAAREQVRLRREKCCRPQEINGKTVLIDGFNTVITLEVMLCGSPVFDCMDGAVRDLAALRGTYRIIEETKRAAALLFSCLAECGAAGAAIYLDRPVSNSGRLRQLLAEVGENYPLQLAFHVQNDVDRALYEQAYVISSDSVILDRCRSWFNAGRLCLERTGARALRIWEKEGGGRLSDGS